MNAYSITPALTLPNVIPEEIYGNSENFVLFLKAYYEWLNTSTFTVEVISGTFVAGETFVGQTTFASAKIQQKKSPTEFVVFVTTNIAFNRFETLVGQTSGATAKLVSQTDNTLRQSANLIKYRDVDQSIDIFADYLKNELYDSIPNDFDGDKRFLAKKIRDFYQSKGQEQAYRFFMRLLYGEEIDVIYPGVEVLKVSDGQYEQQKIIRAELIGGASDDTIFQFLFKTIRGRTSGAIANVVDVKKTKINTYDFAEMQLSFVSGTFAAGEEIYDIADTSATPLETTIYGMVSDYEIINGGSGYQIGDTITVSGDGENATVKITDVEVSKINSIKVYKFGEGYRLGTLATIDNSGTGGSNLAIKVTEIANTFDIIYSGNTYTLGTVSKITIVNRGSDYYDAPTINLVDSVVANIGFLSDKVVTIANSGNTYTIGDTVSFTGLYGAGASLSVASVSLNGEVSRANYIRNNMMVGASTTSNTLPTHWNESSNTITGITKSITAIGEENRIKYIDVRLQGTPSATANYLLITDTLATPASNNETWSFSTYLKLSSGSTANISGLYLSFDEKTSANVFVKTANSNTVTVNTSDLGSQRKQLVANTSGGATVGGITPYIGVRMTSGLPVDITLRIGMPQLELGNTVTSVIPTFPTAGLTFTTRPSNETTNDYNIYLENDDKLIDESWNTLKYDTTNTTISVWAGIGGITRLETLTYGTGYKVSNLPTAAASTYTGSNATFSVTNILGNNANVVVDIANNSGGIGSIIRVEPVSFGIDYSNATIDATTTGNGDANIQAVISGLSTVTGEYISDRSKLNYSKIQDSYYYQDFSYVIKSGIEISKYRNLLKKLVHPAGLEVFGEISIVNTINLTTGATFPDVSNIILEIIINLYDDVVLRNLEARMVDYFLGDLAYTTLGEVPIFVIQNAYFSQYQYYTFNSPFGEAIYFKYTKNEKVVGQVNIEAGNTTILGFGTAFLGSFSSGDPIVVSKTISPGVKKEHAMVINTVLSNTELTVQVPPNETVTDANVYVSYGLIV